MYALYAHLAPGSITVGRGQGVAEGRDRPGSVNTGNWTAPHLHFQLMDSAAPNESRGIPCAFAEYLVEHHTGWERIERGVRRDSTGSGQFGSQGRAITPQSRLRRHWTGNRIEHVAESARAVRPALAAESTGTRRLTSRTASRS